MKIFQKIKINYKYFFNFFRKKNKLFSIENLKYINYTESSAQSLRIIIESVKSENKKINILIPFLFCGITIKKFKLETVDIYFYNLNSDLTPDYEYISKNYSNIQFDLFVLVHYFGNVSKSNQLNADEFCNKNNISLVEDCAHIISPKVTNKWFGDFLLFSPHKFINTPSIGVLYSNNPKLKPLFEKSKFPFKWMVLYIFKSMLPLVILRTKLKNISNKDIMDYKLPHKTVIYNTNHVLNNINLNHYENFIIDLINLLKQKKMWKPIFDETKMIPHIFGMTCDNEELALNRMKFLNKNHKLAMLWPDDIDFKKDSVFKKKFYDFKNKTIFFILDINYDLPFYLFTIKKIISNPKF